MAKASVNYVIINDNIIARRFHRKNLFAKEKKVFPISKVAAYTSGLEKLP